jgi:IS5 family transposase
MAGQPGLFDLDERDRALSESGDPLIRLATLIDFEVFRAPLVSALKRSDGTRGGRPAYDPVLMFKVVVLQTLYTLSDDATEFQIRDRVSFMRFLGLGLEHPVPDAKTVWLFREQLTRAGAIEGLFATFDAALKAEGYLAMSGQIVDASIVVCPKQRNTDAEQQAIKAGHIPEGWQDQPKRLAQKDRDARWTLKRARTKATTETTRKRRVEIAIPVFGYKNHVSIDRAYGFVRRFAVTNAAAYDGAQLGAVLDKSNTASPVWADTAYRSKANEALLEKNGFVSKVHFRRRPGFGLTPVQRRANRARSRVRSAIETVFAAQKRRFGLIVRTIGIARATTKIGLANLTYNMRRLIWWETRIHPA